MSRVIDCSKPENYVLQWSWRAAEGKPDYEILGLFPQRDDNYLVVFRNIDGSVVASYGNTAEDIRDKPKWEPEVGKLYMFAHVNPDAGRVVGVCRELLDIDNKNNSYVADNHQRYEYCWPIPEDYIGD